MPRTIPALAFAATLLVGGASHAPPDLDVGIPPGSPTEWGQRFPSITPRDQPVFPLTGGRQVDDPTRTVSRGAVPELEVQIADTFGIVRILTWDVAGHLRWVNAPETGAGTPSTGTARGEAALPQAGSALHWTTTAALLRLLLHPQLVSEPELIAHLVEIGEPALPMAATARVEPALRDACRELLLRITTGRRAARPLPGANARADMLSRLVYDELVQTFPYDPEGGFGRRMFLFSQELERVLIRYTAHDDSLLRRNAVAALARYRTADASDTLLRTAVRPEDPVAQMRALAAMDSKRTLRAPDVLVQRLRLSDDPVEQVALIQALGRIGLSDAVPTLLELGTERDVDTDLLLAIVTALVRIRHEDEVDEVERFADRLASRARSGPERFLVRRDQPAPAADRPDSPRTRGEVMAQLALLLQVRLAPEERLVNQVVALVSPAGGGSGRGGRGNRSLSEVHPPAQMLFLEALRELGMSGLAPLRSVAGDRSVEPVLRGRALTLLPSVDRASLAIGILQSTDESDEMKIYALELLGVDGHSRLRELAEPLLASCADVAGEVPAPELRYLWLTTLRALERRSLLKVTDLLPLLERVTAPITRAKAIEEIRGLVVRLVTDAAVGLTRSTLRERIDKVLEPMVEHALNDAITAATVATARDQVRRHLQGLRGHRADTGYHKLVTDAVLRYLLGFRAPRLNPNRAEFAPVVLLEEEILLALGRGGTPSAVVALKTFLQEHKDNPFRAQACLAAGVTGDRELAHELVPYLLDEDGFVRLCAYESLRHLTGEDYFADFLYGDPSERGAAAEQWYRWSIRNR